jgi:hypothetical protein
MSRRALVLGGGTVVLAGAGLYSLYGGPDYDAAAAALWVHQAARPDNDFLYLVHHAQLAANSHNTQAWHFRQTPSGATITPDLTRATPVVDPDNHHLFVSLGCAAENMLLAAGATGRPGTAAFVDAADGRIDVDLGRQPGTADPLFQAIPDRHCARSDYDGPAITPPELALLRKAAEIDGCQLSLITARDRIEQVLRLILAANTAQLLDQAFVAELGSWLRFNARAAIVSGDGLYSACSGNPTGPTWLARILFRLALKPDAENDRAARQVRSSAGLAIFHTDQDDKAHWVQAGRSYQRFALQATALGLRHAFLNQPVEVAQIRPELATLLGLGTRRTDLVVRFGHGPAMPPALRRPLGSVIVTA